MNIDEYYDSLYHHGVLGQKWGVRRYVDSNGRLTPAGKMRYREDGTRLTLNNMTKKEYDYALEQMERERRFKEAQKNSRGEGSSIKSTFGKVAVMAAATAATMGLTAALSDDGIQDGKKLVRNMLLAVGTSAISTVASSFGAPTANTYGQKQGIVTNSTLVKTRNLQSVVGNPSGMQGADSEKAYQSLFKRNPTEDQKAVIKGMRRNGYSPEQIEKYVFHSGISSGTVFVLGVVRA